MNANEKLIEYAENSLKHTVGKHDLLELRDIYFDFSSWCFLHGHTEHLNYSLFLVAIAEIMNKKPSYIYTNGVPRYVFHDVDFIGKGSHIAENETIYPKESLENLFPTT